jgi:hypothetical protein
MKKALMGIALYCLFGSASADNVADSDRLLCSSSQAALCFETGQCFPIMPWEADVPQFIVIDKKKKRIATPKGSEEQRTTPITSLGEADGIVFLQGFEAGRAFSIVINEQLGTLTASVARDGIAVSVFGNCTDADI